MRLSFIIALLGFSFLACEEKDCCVIVDPACYSFDIRQCGTDGFADDISENDNVFERESGMKDWLSDNGVAVLEVKLVRNFHDAVCEACHTCPQGDRYFVHLDNSLVISDLELLNLEMVDCSDHF